jgi:hypothetical protein
MPPSTTGPSACARLDVPVLVRWKAGTGLKLGRFDSPRVTLDVRDAKGAAALLSPSLDSLGEAYVEGHLDVTGTVQDIIDVAHRLATAGGGADPDKAGWMGRMVRRVADARHHSKSEDRAAIHYHYDVSNAFYAQWLDPAMVYSCAYFETGETLEQAQQKRSTTSWPSCAWSPASACWTSAAAGARWCCARRRSSARAAWASRCRKTSSTWPASACAPPASRTASRSGCRTTATSPRRSTASPAWACASTSG